MVKGTVKWFDEAKGYGFLLQEKGDEVFCHCSAIIGQGLQRLAEGDQVTFDVVQGPQGLEAANVIKI